MTWPTVPGVEHHLPRPPRRGDAGRRGDAKAGNSILAMSCSGRYDVDWVETRDADDAVGSPDFLNNCLGQLTADDDLAFSNDQDRSVSGRPIR